MRKILTALVAAGSLAAAVAATPTAADARWGGWHGWGWGPAVGGFAAGAIIGSALAAPYYYGYYAPYPYYGRPCVWRSVWNGYAWARACV
jgi:hypothetical protein